MTDQYSSSRNAQAFSVDVAHGDERMRFLDSLGQQIRRPLDGMLAVTDLLRRQPLTPDALAYVRTLEDHYQTRCERLTTPAIWRGPSTVPWS